MRQVYVLKNLQSGVLLIPRQIATDESNKYLASPNAGRGSQNSRIWRIIDLDIHTSKFKIFKCKQINPIMHLYILVFQTMIYLKGANLSAIWLVKIIIN